MTANKSNKCMISAGSSCFILHGTTSLNSNISFPHQSQNRTNEISSPWPRNTWPGIVLFYPSKAFCSLKVISSSFPPIRQDTLYTGNPDSRLPGTSMTLGLVLAENQFWLLLHYQISKGGKEGERNSWALLID